MSIPRLSEESSQRPPSSSDSLKINAGRSGAAFTDEVTNCSTGGENGQAEEKFTEEEIAIHRRHKEACAGAACLNWWRYSEHNAKKQMYVDPSSGYKVFTEYAHLQRGKCCGSACRHLLQTFPVMGHFYPGRFGLMLTRVLYLVFLAHWFTTQLSMGLNMMCPYGQANVKDPANRKRFNSLFYV